MDKLISLVIPMYCENQVARECYRRVKGVMVENDIHHEIIFISTPARLKQTAADNTYKNPMFFVLLFIIYSHYLSILFISKYFTSIFIGVHSMKPPIGNIPMPFTSCCINPCRSSHPFMKGFPTWPGFP